MSTSTVLVIDDSATIRKLVDSHLSQEGYRVVLAPNAEIGLKLAREVQPDLILLDHQLPGTTGIEVCKQIIQFPECTRIPFVISSTLRNQAYAEYVGVPNVVDSLPKPFKPELLKMTVANALEVGAMVVASQAGGTAVPEVVEETSQAALSGDFRWIGLREVLDFLCNGSKQGLLEVELEHTRIWFFLQGGRIQCVSSASFDQDEVARRMPPGLRDLAPLLRFTMSSGFSAQVDGLLELMDKRVLDPRMLRTLLRHQAAVLTRHCFLHPQRCFTFYPDRPVPPLFRKSPLETSLTALLVEGALCCPASELTPSDGSVAWTRRALRGQNLDRAGLNARHLQLFAQLDGGPFGLEDLAQRSQLPRDEAHRVLDGFRLADWCQTQIRTEQQTVVALEPDAAGSALLREVLSDAEGRWTGKVVRDELGLQLLLRRGAPDLILVALSGESQLELPARLRASGLPTGSETRVGLIAPASGPPVAPALSHYPLLRRPYSASDLGAFLDRCQNSPAAAGGLSSATCSASVTVAPQAVPGAP